MSVMTEFTIVTMIGRPVDEVFAVITDLAQTPVWTPGLSEVRQTSDGPLAPGAAIVYTGTFLGRSFKSHAVCTGLTENKLFATKTTTAPFYLEVQTALEPTADGTRVTSVYRGESRGFVKLAEPLVVRMGRKQFETSNENLRTLLEDRALSPHSS
jgi:uncharacterized protein YndB with AHSA1/START domain